MLRFLCPILAGSLLLPWSAVRAELPLHRLSMPEGFKIEVFAENVPNARAMARGSQGTLFVGSRTAGKVYAIPVDEKNRAQGLVVIDQGLSQPAGVAFREGDLYVSAVTSILRYEDIENRLDDPPDPVVVYDQFENRHHGWKYLAFGPDGLLYVPVGAPCNICDEPGFAKISRMTADGGQFEDYAFGVRNSVGFDWHPESGELWFTDNGRDRLGDDIPPCELNRVSQQNQHFGYPFCHAGEVSDPEFGDQRSCNEFVAPAQKLGPHVAPLGMKFYTGDMFPERYRNQIFIAEHGSWNRSEKIGYRITLVTLKDSQAQSYQPFVSGWHEGDDVWGRPVDLLLMDDGSMLVSDDFANAIYRISFHPEG